MRLLDGQNVSKHFGGIAALERSYYEDGGYTN